MAERLTGRWLDSQGYGGVRGFDEPQEKKEDRVHAKDGIQSRSEKPRFLGPTRFSGGTGCRCTVVMTPGERLRREFQPNLRDEMLNTGIFYMLKEAIVLIEGWSYRYDMVRPHSSLRS